MIMITIITKITIMDTGMHTTPTTRMTTTGMLMTMLSTITTTTTTLQPRGRSSLEHYYRTPHLTRSCMLL